MSGAKSGLIAIVPSSDGWWTDGESVSASRSASEASPSDPAGSCTVPASLNVNSAWGAGAAATRRSASLGGWLLPQGADQLVARSPKGSTSTSCPRPPPGGRADQGRVRPSSAGWAGGVGVASGGGKPDPQSRLDWSAHDRITAGQGLCGRDRIRTCVGNAGDLTGRTAVPRGSRPIPTWSRSSHVTCTNGLPTASAVPLRPCPFRPVPRDPALGGGKAEGNPGCHLTPEFPYFLPAFVSPTAGATAGSTAGHRAQGTSGHGRRRRRCSRSCGDDHQLDRRARPVPGDRLPRWQGLRRRVRQRLR
jgi:hypothetical protein